MRKLSPEKLLQIVSVGKAFRHFRLDTETLDATAWKHLVPQYGVGLDGGRVELSVWSWGPFRIVPYNGPSVVLQLNEEGEPVAWATEPR